MTGHHAVLVHVDGTVTAETYDTINLATLTEATGARYVDCVRVRRLGDSDLTLDAWVDDEGLLNGSQPNPVAAHMVAALADCECQMLSGRVLFVTGDSTTGESLGLSQEHQGALVEMGRIVNTLLARA